MVRTRADAVVTRVAGAKAPRKNLGGPSNANNSEKNGKGREHMGGNSYFPRETPEWQKPITSFFNHPQDKSGESSKRGEQTEFIEEKKDLGAGASTSGYPSTSKEDKTD